MVEMEIELINLLKNCWAHIWLFAILANHFSRLNKLLLLAASFKLFYILFPTLSFIELCYSCLLGWYVSQVYIS